jgi:hypothetical protein
MKRIKLWVPGLAALMLSTSMAFAQTTNDPFPKPIAAGHDVIRVGVIEFAVIPDVGGDAPRMMLLVDEPGTRRLFVNEMRGALFSVSRDGKVVTPYLDINAPAWDVSVQFANSERGFQSFAFHPQFNQRGSRGFGKLYTLTDTTNTTPPPDFTPGGGNNTHDTVLLEWTAKNPDASSYDGGPPRELMRFEQPFANHNGGQLGFNPLTAPRDPEFGLLYIGSADGGSGGDPLDLAQNLTSAFGKILRIDPLGTNSANGKYGVPPGNPFVSDNNPDTLGEIYASGVRNPQRFCWDSKTGSMFVADIGQNIVEEISPVTAGANLGWNDWEGSFAFISRSEVSLVNQRGAANMTYPVVEYGQVDPLLQPSAAVTGVYVYRQSAIKQLTNLLIFGDNPSGEVFAVSADNLPKGGQDAIRRILFVPRSSSRDSAETKTLLELVKAKNVEQGKKPATRADLRFGLGPQGQIFLLNKRDGTIRLLVRESRR